MSPEHLTCEILHLGVLAHVRISLALAFLALLGLVLIQLAFQRSCGHRREREEKSLIFDVC